MKAVAIAEIPYIPSAGLGPCPRATNIMHVTPGMPTRQCQPSTCQRRRIHNQGTAPLTRRPIVSSAYHVLPVSPRQPIAPAGDLLHTALFSGQGLGQACAGWRRRAVGEELLTDTENVFAGFIGESGASRPGQRTACWLNWRRVVRNCLSCGLLRPADCATTQSGCTSTTPSMECSTFGPCGLTAYFLLCISRQPGGNSPKTSPRCFAATQLPLFHAYG